MRKSLSAGLLKHKVTFEHVIKSKNDFGEFIENYVTKQSLRAEIIRTHVNQEQIANGLVPSNYKVFRIRYKAWVNISLFINFKGVRYAIKAIENPNENNKQLIITTEAL